MLCAQTYGASSKRPSAIHQEFAAQHCSSVVAWRPEDWSENMDEVSNTLDHILTPYQNLFVRLILRNDMSMHLPSYELEHMMTYRYSSITNYSTRYTQYYTV